MPGEQGTSSTPLVEQYSRRLSIQLADSLISDPHHYPDNVSQTLSLELGLLFSLHPVAWKCRYGNLSNQENGCPKILYPARSAKPDHCQLAKECFFSKKPANKEELESPVFPRR